MFREVCILLVLLKESPQIVLIFLKRLDFIHKTRVSWLISLNLLKDYNMTVKMYK